MIAHWITSGTCGQRQARNYHKCYACRFGYGEKVVEAALAPLPRPNVKEPTAPAAQAV